MADDMVDRDARGVLITLIADGGRGDAAPDDLFADEIINGCSRDPDFDVVNRHVQNFSGDPACFAHACKICILIDANAVFCQSTTDIFHALALRFRPR